MLQVRQLEKRYEHRSVLQIDEFDLLPGEAVAIIGPVGSGKTTLIRVLAGMLLPSGGTVTIEGQDIYRHSSLKQQIGVMFEEDLLYDRHSARGNLELCRRLYNLPRERTSETLALLGLNDQADKTVSKLSPSTQRRLAFARLYMTHPSVVLLDQPTLRADFETQQLFTRLLIQLMREGKSILLTDEDGFWARKFCSRVVEIEHGHLTSVYQPATKEEPGSPEQRAPYKVPARKDDRIMLFNPGDILYAASRDGKTVLYTLTEEATTNLSLQELESRLTGRGFFKAHRAYLVNLQHIRSVIQYTRNSYTLQLNDPQGTMIPLSKQCEKELQELLGY